MKRFAAALLFPLLLAGAAGAQVAPFDMSPERPPAETPPPAAPVPRPAPAPAEPPPGVTAQPPAAPPAAGLPPEKWSSLK